MTAETGMPPIADATIDDDGSLIIAVDTEDALNAWATWLGVEVDVFKVGVAGGSGWIRYLSVRRNMPVVVGWTEEATTEEAAS